MGKIASAYKAYFVVAIAVALLCLALSYWPLRIFPFRSPASVPNLSDRYFQGSYHDVAIPPEATDQYSLANYRLWIPGGVSELRGLIVKQHGCGDINATGLTHANDLQWQALAVKHQFALLGTQLHADGQPCEYWALINYGSGNAFFKALHKLAKDSQHPELEKIPWVLWGHSGGADWTAQMLQQYPEKTLAMVGVRGGGFLFFGYNPTLSEIPVLFTAGKNDPYAHETLQLPKDVFFRYRKNNAPWTFAVEADAAHETGDTRSLAIPYLDTILTAQQSKIGNSTLPLANIQEVWLGDLITHTVAPAEQYPGNKLEAVWLPDKTSAIKWQQYVSSGKIEPIEKPQVPVNVRISKTQSSQAILTWDYTPDLENGLPSFHIYRNNKLVTDVKGQGYDSGDAPQPMELKLSYTDKNPQVDVTYVVAAFNTLGENAADPIRLPPENFGK